MKKKLLFLLLASSTVNYQIQAREVNICALGAVVPVCVGGLSLLCLVSGLIARKYNTTYYPIVHHENIDDLPLLNYTYTYQRHAKLIKAIIGLGILGSATAIGSLISDLILCR